MPTLTLNVRLADTHGSVRTVTNSDLDRQKQGHGPERITQLPTRNSVHENECANRK